MTRMFSTGYASIDIIKGLKLKETLSYDYNIQKDSRYWNPLSGAGAKSGSDAQTAKGFIEYSKLISSTSLGYNTTIAQLHHVDALIAYEIENYQTDKAMGDKSKLPSDYLVEPDNAASLNSFVSSTQDSRMISYVSRINYDYDDRYYIAGSFRRDGSSRLSPENRWGNFWSVSGMWNVGAEKFMQSIKSVLSDLKIRASYGVNGNQPGALYGYMGLYSYGQNYMGGGGSYESALPNPNLKWEKNYNLNLGLDLAFINRIFVSLEYYNRDTKDLLYNRPISSTTGFQNYLGNLGQLNNRGWELELRTINFAGSNFNWTSVLNMTHNKNKIVSLDGKLEQSIEGSWFIHKVGLPYSTFYVKEYAGVDPQTGKALYYMNTQDANGNVVQPQEQPWADVADLNFDNEIMQQAMIDAMKYWVTEIGIDGYRCDYAEGVPDAFWKKAIAELRTLDNNLLMLAEGGKTSLMNNGFNLLYGWNFHSKLKDYYAGKCSLTDLYAMNTSELEGMPKGTLRLRYSTNHDQASEASPIECYGGERGAMSAFVLTTMLEGIPLIYSSQEVAYPRSLNFFNYGVIDLKSNEVFAQEMAEIIRAYKATSSVRGGELEVYTTGDAASFYRAAGSHGMLVMVNTANESVQVKVPMEHAGKTMTDVIAGVDVELPTVMTMEPYQYFIYQQ